MGGDKCEFIGLERLYWELTWGIELRRGKYVGISSFKSDLSWGKKVEFFFSFGGCRCKVKFHILHRKSYFSSLKSWISSLSSQIMFWNRGENFSFLQDFELWRWVSERVVGEGGKFIIADNLELFFLEQTTCSYFIDLFLEQPTCS